MRRLPIYLVLDVSGSMLGEPIEAVRNGMALLSTALRQNPYALETAYLSVISFGNEANQLLPLTELSAFNPPPLNAMGSTALGAALKLLAECIRAEVLPTTADRKGDWRPLVFFMTDGAPTDDIQVGLEAFQASKVGVVVACAAGPHAKVDVLQKITENVISLDTADSNAIGAFFKWVSASIGLSSQRVESGQEAKGLDELPPPPPELNIAI
jgi:uncharacterized protein YegL